MALTVRQAAEQYLDEIAVRQGGEARAAAAGALDALMREASHAPGAAPTRTNPNFPRKGAAGSALGEVWVYELQPEDLDEWIRLGPGASLAPDFLSWLWNQGYLGADRYEGLLEALDLPADGSVRLRRLEHRLMQVARERQQHLQEHLLNPVLYLGLAGDPYQTGPPAPELEGDLEVLRVDGGALWGRIGEVEAGPLEVGPEAAALALPGDRIYLVLGRNAGTWLLLEAHPSFPPPDP